MSKTIREELLNNILIINKKTNVKHYNTLAHLNLFCERQKINVVEILERIQEPGSSIIHIDTYNKDIEWEISYVIEEIETKN